MLSVVWENNEAEPSTTFTSLQYDHIRRPTQFNIMFGSLSSVIGLLCIAVIILLSVWRYRRQQMLMAAIARRHGGRRLITTYPQLQMTGGAVIHAAVALPPPYCEAVAAPPPYSVVDSRQPKADDPQPNLTHDSRVATGSHRQSADEADNLLSQQV